MTFQVQTPNGGSDFLGFQNFSGTNIAKITAADASANALTITTGNSGTTAAMFDTNQNATMNYISAQNTFGFKNRLINGNMAVWQRGTSFTGITNIPTYTADRWGAFVAAVVAGEQVIQSSSVPTGSGFKYSAAFGRTAGNTNTNSIWFNQLIESSNMLDLAGQSVTLSFWAKTGANYSGGSMTVYIRSGTSADQSLATYSGGPCTGYTGDAAVVSTTQALTTTWTKFSYTGSVGSTGQELAVSFGYTPTGTAGSDDNIYITGVQLEKGSIATPFDYRDYGRELAMCQRYYSIPAPINGVSLTGFVNSTTNYYVPVFYPVTMRAVPTVNVLGTIGNVTAFWQGSSVVATNYSTNSNTNQGCYTVFVVASGLTSGQAIAANMNSTNSIVASAEL